MPRNHPDTSRAAPDASRAEISTFSASMSPRANDQVPALGAVVKVMVTVAGVALKPAER